MRPTPFRGPPSPFPGKRYLSRARQFRSAAINLVGDMQGAEPNWPKYFLLGHAIELTIKAYLVFLDEELKQQRPAGLPEPGNHDLKGLYDYAVARGLKRNTLVTEDLPHLSELHQIHYARYPVYEAKAVALISQFDDVADQLIDDVGAAIGP